ncbi:potassium-transporting ATPase subunit C [Clostridia bacterium]|nr:potassium-transporting ATPase subunit C [Clostridia bacterium]
MYRPKQGDIVWLNLDPQAGHEQKGRRPALIVSNDTFNRRSPNGAMICPITNTNRKNPLQVPLDVRTTTTGIIMCEQAKSLDVQSRQVDFIEQCPRDILKEVSDIIVGIVAVES